MKKFVVVLSFATVTSGVLGMDGQRFSPDSKVNSGVPLRENVEHFFEDEFKIILSELSGLSCPISRQKYPDYVRAQIQRISRALGKSFLEKLLGFIEKGDISGLNACMNEHPEIKEDQFTKDALLMTSVRIRQKESVNYMIDLGANPNVKTKEDYSPLLCATNDNCTDIAKYLIEHGADVNAVSRDQDTPIMWASKHNNFEVVKLLLKHGAKESINVANKEGVTTAIWAASNNNLKMLRLLVENGVNTNKKDKNGFVPMDCALQNDNEEMALFLIESGLKFEEKLTITKEPPLIWFAYKNNLKLVKILVEKGAKVNVKSSVGDTPLMFAVNNNNYEMVQCLVNHGAEVTAKNNDGDTLIQIAGRNRNRRIVQLLLEHIGQAPAA